MIRADAGRSLLASFTLLALAATACEKKRTEVMLGVITDLTARGANVFEVPVAEMAQRDQRCLALAMRDHGGNPLVDEATEARQKNGGSSSNSRRGHRVGRGIVEHRHGYFLRKGWRSPVSLYACFGLLKL